MRQTDFPKEPTPMNNLQQSHANEATRSQREETALQWISLFISRSPCSLCTVQCHRRELVAAGCSLSVAVAPNEIYILKSNGVNESKDVARCCSETKILTNFCPWWTTHTHTHCIPFLVSVIAANAAHANAELIRAFCCNTFLLFIFDPMNSERKWEREHKHIYLWSVVPHGKHFCGKSGEIRHHLANHMRSQLAHTHTHTMYESKAHGDSLISFIHFWLLLSCICCQKDNTAHTHTHTIVRYCCRMNNILEFAITIITTNRHNSCRAEVKWNCKNGTKSAFWNSKFASCSLRGEIWFKSLIVTCRGVRFSTCKPSIKKSISISKEMCQKPNLEGKRRWEQWVY